MPNRERVSGTSFSAAISAWLTASHPNSEVKQARAGVVLRWGTTREGLVLRFSFFIRLLFFWTASPFAFCSSGECTYGSLRFLTLKRRYTRTRKTTAV